LFISWSQEVGRSHNKKKNKTYSHVYILKKNISSRTSRSISIILGKWDSKLFKIIKRPGPLQRGD
jgi:hypothetical protein